MDAQTIISRAFREGNLIPVGTTPTTDEQTEGLATLNAFMRALIGHEAGEKLSDWEVPAGQRATSNVHATAHAPFPASVEGRAQFIPGPPVDTAQAAFPPANSRLLIKITSATTVYFPEKPQPGARMSVVDVGASAALTLHGNGRLIEGAATKVLSAGFSVTEWFYREDTASWTVFDDMALTDGSVLPNDFDEFLVVGLMIRLSGTYGLTPRSSTIEAYDRGLSKLKARYRQHAMTVGRAHDTPRSAQTYHSGLSEGSLY